MKSDPQVCGLGEGVTQGPLIKGKSQGENYSAETTVLNTFLSSCRPPGPTVHESLHAHTWLCVCVCVCVCAGVRTHGGAKTQADGGERGTGLRGPGQARGPPKGKNDPARAY